ncbi:Rrf2 family transcriptional regulator [Paenibacillus sp. MMS18-CY102]|uniref:Rrf2 family transcriptional regulator n=1 Tax=Paenibacillus sp. MMS18-CY102 TaxID=2682849 RepID=UPI001365329D|nr:Rrf2 family transcriptional regulator [Paenibacillus sp. MMS18-CY102]MWC31162.1 transcriptional regulator [Paenibacillus sp. MMS18-CY102]
MSRFEQKFEEWIQAQIVQETNPRRRELLEKGLGHGTVDFLRNVWFPAVRNFDHLYPEWEVRDFNNGYRYVDLAYMPGRVKGGIEIQGYGPHARDLDVKRFKDLCWRQCLLALDDWIFLPVAYLSIKDEPQRCQQLVLSFIGKFISTDVLPEWTWLEAEAARFSRRLLRPFTPSELASHLRITDRHARRLLHKLVESGVLTATGGKIRYRLYSLRLD